MPESPLEPQLDPLPRPDRLPLLLQHFLVLDASRVLLTCKAQHPKRENDPAHRSEPHRALAEHQPPEPEIRLQEPEQEQTRQQHGDDNNPCRQGRAARQQRAHLIVVERARTPSAAATATPGRRRCWVSTIPDIITVVEVIHWIVRRRHLGRVDQQRVIRVLAAVRIC